MLKKKKTTASGEPVMVQSVRRTRSRRMKFCVQRGLGALPSTGKAEGKITAGFFPLRAECINTGIACARKEKTEEQRPPSNISTNKNSDTSPTVVSEFTGPDGSHRTMETGRNHTT